MNKYELISKFNSLLIYLPYSIIKHIITFVEYLVSPQLRYNLKNNKSLKGKYNGKRCFIVGNGPSLKRQNLDFIKNEYTFVTNSFILHEQIKNINPSFYCIVDPAMYNGIFPKERLEAMEKELPTTEFFFRYRSLKFLKNNRLFEKSKVHLIKNESYLNDFTNLNIGLGWCVPGTVNVIHTCILLAAYMGFNEIYLIGCDSTLFMPRQDHFYKESEEEKKNMVHFDQSLFYTSYMFRSYRIIKSHFDKKGVKIFNATEGGALEVFPRVEFESLFRDTLTES